MLKQNKKKIFIKNKIKSKSTHDKGKKNSFSFSCKLLIYRQIFNLKI
jgi:hypothetical protein